MAHIADNSRTAGQRAQIGSLWARFSDVVRQRRTYHRTYAELNALSTRELNDLGISRSMISRLAYEAAFKN